MKVAVTCHKCGYKVERELDVELDTNRLVEAFRFFQEQVKQHNHPEVNDNFKWTLGWENKPDIII